MENTQDEILRLMQQMDGGQRDRLLNVARQMMVLPRRTYSPRELLRLSPEEHEQYIAQSFAAAADEDFEVFEAQATAAIALCVGYSPD